MKWPWWQQLSGIPKQMNGKPSRIIQKYGKVVNVQINLIIIIKYTIKPVEPISMKALQPENECVILENENERSDNDSQILFSQSINIMEIDDTSKDSYSQKNEQNLILTGETIKEKSVQNAQQASELNFCLLELY